MVLTMASVTTIGALFKPLTAPMATSRFFGCKVEVYNVCPRLD